MEGISDKKTGGLLKNRNFMLLFIGQVVSNLGNAVFSIAVVWYIMSLVGENDSGAYIGIFGMCTLIPFIVFGPISGVYVDKIDRKKIIVGTDVIRGLIMIALMILMYIDFYPLVSLFVLTIISVIFGTFFNPAVNASIPNVVDEEQLIRANSLM